MNNTVAALADIVQNKEIAPNIYHMKIKALDIAKKAVPGQFLHIRCGKTLSPLLRRPISIADIDEKTGCVEIIYRVVGEGTRLLSQSLTGHELDIIGPLGNGFPLPEKDAPCIIVAGGIGTAPIIYLAKKIASEPKNENSVTIVLGFTTKSEVFGEGYLKFPGVETIIATDDGSYGYKGFPTDILERLLQEHMGKTDPIIYSCGPKPMLIKVKEIAASKNVRAYLSLEEHMACGVGACLGCSVKSSGKGYKKVCKDGPVFEAGEVELH